MFSASSGVVYGMGVIVRRIMDKRNLQIVEYLQFYRDVAQRSYCTASLKIKSMLKLI